MARKSRRITEQTTVPVLMPEITAERTAIYARLSIENSGKDDNGDSIENQISFCREYVEERPYLKLEKVYADNGEKGTNFDRPQFQGMMEDIRAGKIQCVVVKDLSRFGRDYIECGYYLEKIFPFMNVRFVAITDNYDSFTSGDSEGALMVPLKNMINAAYAKDISRKIITSFRARQEKGEFLPAFAPYGYVKSKTAAYRYEVDSETAPYVKMIFEWKAAGVSHNEISRRLTEIDAVTPALRKVQLGIWRAEKYKSTTWYGRTIIDILKNRAYTGCIVYGKMPKSLYEGIKMHRAKPEEWRIIPDTHEALVSQELYDRVQEMFAERSRNFAERKKANEEELAGYTNFLKGKIYCGDCRKRMRYIKPSQPEKNPYDIYVCGGYVDSRYANCTRHSIHAEDVNAAVAAAVRSQIQAAADAENIIKAFKGSAGEYGLKEKQQGKINEISRDLQRITEKKNALYENMVEGILDDEEYLYAKEKYEVDCARLNEELENALAVRKQYESILNLDSDWIRTVHTFRKTDGITQQMVDVFVKEVCIFEKQRIEITLNYADEAERMAKVIAEVEQNG